MTDTAVPVVNAGYDGFGGNDANWFLWIVVLFALFSGNGFGWGNRDGAVATQSDLQRGFDTNTIVNKLDGITNGLCDGFYALNNSVKDNAYATQSAIAGLSAQNAQCCLIS